LLQLREISASFDLEAPPFARLKPIAKACGLPEDFRITPPRPDDVGLRPDLVSLGPFRWQPSSAPQWTLEDSHGKRHALAEYRGRPVVIIFFLGSGCLHCAEQLQAFAPAARDFEKAGISLIGISSDNRDGLKVSLDNYKSGSFPFPLVSDASLDVFKAYRAYDDFENMVLHGTFLVDRNGRVRWQDISYEPFMEPTFLLHESQRLLSQDAPAATAAR
jgi:peroxiredoxin